MSKITFGENFYSSLLLSTFLGAVVVSAGFISSATAMERSPSGYGSSEDERDLPVAVNGMSLEERNSVAVRLELKEERRELKQFLASVRTQPSYLSLTADDWADFNQAMTSTTGALSESYTENRSPATRMAKIKAWLGDRQADRQAEQEMGRFLASVRTQPSYLSLTADDWADFNQAMTSSTGKFSLSYAENQRPATRMAKIKAWLEARHVLRSAEQQIDNFLANVKTQPSYTSLTADDWAAFDHEMTSSTGKFSLSYAENQRP
ncbi:MAG: hypothetical protein NWS47_04885, partial [Alphaproteobacteria bacterium]|nr:hypothetical protein [Alphaproteobacteria bacterium]